MTYSMTQFIVNLRGFEDATHVFDIGIGLLTRHGSLVDVVQSRQDE